ncbi:hypothetical protein GE061_015326 [Apolygus lucorum]|uniref:Uncharacterized protein n=1 Tax=Apolygus lucorum TaxID=248454 RepID=A0A8S9XMV5_APOLU|nr:hypothetical protein GE061_015326 [Apolygus lucorum]
MQSGSPEEIKREGRPSRVLGSVADDFEVRRRTSLRSSRLRTDQDNVSFFRLITVSGWLLLVTKLILAVVVEKVALENTIESHVATAGLLLKDTLRRLYCNYGINLLIGIALGVISDLCGSKKMIMVLVLCLSIGYYFYMVVGGLEPTTSENPEFENKWPGPFSRLLGSQYNTLDILDLSQRALILVMLPLVEFVVVPFILRQILRQKITFVIRLACSMITGVVAYMYGIVVVRMLMARGSPLPDNWTSGVRFVNALNYSVVIRPTDKSFSSGIVQAKSDLLLTYVRSGKNYIPVREVFEVQLESQFKYVTAVSLEGEECVSYFVTDFMEIQRVPGVDPIFEGPPGTNYPLKARMYFANLDPELSVQLVLTFQHSTFHDNQIDEPVIIEVSGGNKRTFQINTGTYILTIAHVDVSKSYTFGPGGVYGVIYSPEVKEETLNYMVVQISRPKEFSIVFALVYDCLIWIAISFVVVFMEVLVFLKSPHNCRSLAFSFYFFFIGGFLPLCHYGLDLAINKSGYVGWWALILYLTGYVTMCLITSFIVVRNRKWFSLKGEDMART